MCVVPRRFESQESQSSYCGENSGKNQDSRLASEESGAFSETQIMGRLE